MTWKKKKKQEERENMDDEGYILSGQKRDWYWDKSYLMKSGELSDYLNEFIVFIYFLYILYILHLYTNVLQSIIYTMGLTN